MFRGTETSAEGAKRNGEECNGPTRRGGTDRIGLADRTTAIKGVVFRGFYERRRASARLAHANAANGAIWSGQVFGTIDGFAVAGFERIAFATGSAAGNTFANFGIFGAIRL
jgi:hypothetical protein